MSLKFESTATSPDSWLQLLTISWAVCAALKMPSNATAHSPHERRFDSFAFCPAKPAHIHRQSLPQLTSNWGRCGKDWAGDTVAVYASCTNPARKLEYLSFHFSPSQKGRETRATGASDLLHLHSTSDMETHSPWHLVCHWKKVNTGTQTFWYFSFLEPLKLLGRKTKSHKAFHQRAPLEHKFYFQQPIYPRPSFDRYEVTIPLANPKGISWAITSCFHLEPRTQERFIS